MILGHGFCRNAIKSARISSPSPDTGPTGICYNRSINLSYKYNNKRFSLCLTVRLQPVPKMTDSANPNQTTEATGSYLATSQPRTEPALTTFYADDSIGEVASIPAPTELDPGLVSAVDVGGTKTIIDFLEKPTRLDTASITTTDSGKIVILDPWVYLVQTSLKNSKLQGTYMLRADMVITLNLNAVRFQTGRYILAWMPSGGIGTADNGYLAMYRMHTCNLMTITQLPHVEIDIATQTHVELRIPFTSIYTHHVIAATTNPYQSLGNVFLYPYQALQAGSGDSSAYYTIWGRFENITISGAAINQMAPISVARQEQNAAGVGPVSRVLTKVGKAAGIMGEIPLLSSAMSTVSWTSAVLARAANVFGFSKPLVLSAPNRYVKTNLPYIAVSDQVSTAQPLSLVSTNEIKVHPGNSRTNQDELAIDFIKSKYCYWNTVTWSTSDVVDAQLTTLTHDPAQYLTAFGKGYTMAPICLLANKFRQWRGSFKFRFKFVKNEFYSGRIMLTYLPQLSQLSDTFTVVKSEYAWREIVDVRDVNEFEFCIPYVSPNLYSRCGELAGKVYVTVLDPLVAPSSVPNNIPIIIEVCGGDDLEYAVPGGVDMEPYSPAIVQVAELQAGYSEVPCYYFGTAKTPGSIEPAAVAVGEKAESVRQLVKRFTWNRSASTFAPGAAFMTLYTHPTLITPIIQTTNNTTTLVYPKFYSDPICFWSCLYAFSSGSLRMILNSNNTYGKNYWFVGLDNPVATDTDWAGWSATFPYQANVHHVVESTIDGVVDVVVPGYNRTVTRANCAQIVSTNSSLQPRYATNTVAVSIGDPFIGDSNIRPLYPHRMAGEDFNFSCWLGTIPIVYSGVT